MSSFYGLVIAARSNGRVVHTGDRLPIGIRAIRPCAGPRLPTYVRGPPLDVPGIEQTTDRLHRLRDGLRTPLERDLTLSIEQA